MNKETSTNDVALHGSGKGKPELIEFGHPIEKDVERYAAS